MARILSFLLVLTSIFAVSAVEGANGAAILVSESSVPAAIAPATLTTVRIRVRNTGTTTWTRSTAYRLGASDNELLWQGYACGGYMNQLTDGRIFLCHDVPPGAAHDFTFQISTPSSGSRRLSVRMVRDGVEWFGPTERFTIQASSVSRNDAAIEFNSSAVPATIAPGESAPVRVRLRNTGTTVWSADQGYRLGAQSQNTLSWSGFSCGGYQNRLDDARVFLCGDVLPGESYDFSFQVTAPLSASGSLRLSPRMVRDGVEWFGETGAFSVAVESRPTLPDVVVTAASISPATPTTGQAVTFSAVVLNRGTAPTPAGVAIGVAYFVDGQYRTWGAVITSLAPGASVTVTTQGGSWQATSGSHTLTALVDDVNRFDEQNENNNSFSTSFTIGTPIPPPASTDLYGMNVDPANPTGRPTPQAILDLGARWVRIEWKASHGYGFYDPLIGSFRASNVRVLLLVDYSSVPGKPPSNASDSAWAEYNARFAAGVSAIAAHYGNAVDAWQIWNEPDLFGVGTGYDPGVPAHQFGVMLRDTAGAIRAHSSRLVVTGGLASGDPGYLTRARSAIGTLPVDAVAVHPYGQRAPDDWPHASWGFGNMSALFDRYLAFGLPLWVTEAGTTDQSVQAAYLENVYQLARSPRFSGRVTHVFWFCWSDGMVPPYGVVTATGTPKPAYWQYRAVAPP